MIVIDIERSALSAFVLPESMNELWDLGIRQEHFADKTIGAAFQFSMDYFITSKMKECPTKEILGEEFPILISVWSDEYILPSWLSTQLLDKFKQNAVQKAMLDSSALIREDPEKGLQITLAELIKTSQSLIPRKRLASYTETFGTRLDQYWDDITNRKVEKGICSPWQEFTDHTNGFEAGEVAVLIGAPNSGKSWMLGAFALGAARNKTKTYYASLENSSKMTYQRLDCILTGIPFFRYHNGTLTPEERNQLKEAREYVESLGDYLKIDTPTKKTDRTIADMYTTARQWGAEFFVGDQLSWVTPVGAYTTSSSDKAKMDEVITDITMISREMQIASLWGGQFNRESKKGSGGGKLENIGRSSGIEEIVDFAISIWANDQQKQAECLILEILKARRCSLKKWLVAFELQHQTRIEIVRPYEESPGISATP